MTISRRLFPSSASGAGKRSEKGKSEKSLVKVDHGHPIELDQRPSIDWPTMRLQPSRSNCFAIQSDRRPKASAAGRLIARAVKFRFDAFLAAHVVLRCVTASSGSSVVWRVRLWRRKHARAAKVNSLERQSEIIAESSRILARFNVP